MWSSVFEESEKCNADTVVRVSFFWETKTELSLMHNSAEVFLCMQQHECMNVFTHNSVKCLKEETECYSSVLQQRSELKQSVTATCFVNAQECSHSNAKCRHSSQKQRVDFS